MFTLNTLPSIKGIKRTSKRVGRGPGSGLGKTSGRGQKGQGARSGYKRRYGKEGGQVPLFKKVPTRGFSRARFQKKLDTVNLGQIDKMFEDGETVTAETLREKGFLSGKSNGLKVLAKGEITKKVTIVADDFSKSAEEKLAKANVTFKTTVESE